MATRFKLDENLPRSALVLLRNAGHEAQTVLEERLGGSSDSKVLDACRNEERVLITYDVDFGDIRLYPPDSHSGIWVLRPVSQSVTNALTLLRGALTLLERETPQKRLWISRPHP